MYTDNGNGIISIDAPISVVFFGRTGEGKSTLANMLVQEDLGPDNIFPISDGAVGCTSYVTYSRNHGFEIYDTIGLCESSEGTIQSKKAIKLIRDALSHIRKPFNYICYVKRAGKFTEEDKKTFGEFKKIFKGAESNFVIIITDSDSDWTKNNINTIRNYFGNYQVIAVDFPFNKRYSNSDDLKEIRRKNRKHLIDSLINLRYNCIRLEILTKSQYIESKVAQVVSFMPFIGTAYKLISFYVYECILYKPELARKRLEGAIFGGYNDAQTLSSLLGSPSRLLKN